jgi:hypothetical protein
LYLALEIVLSIAAGHVLGTAEEWFWHRVLFHGPVGRMKNGPASFHLHEHHPRVTRLRGLDPAFGNWNFRFRTLGGPHNGRVTEILGLLGVAALHAPLAYWFPWFYAAFVAHGFLYHYTHRRAHLDPEWARVHTPWHWAHHFGHIDKNFCITSEWFDRLVGTHFQWREEQIGSNAPVSGEVSPAG